MKTQQYMSWFRQVVEMGWTCGLYRPQEILANYLIHALPIQPYTDPVPYEHINRFMIDTMMNELMMTEKPTLDDAIKYFNSFYKDNRMDFGAFTREIEYAEEE